MAALVEGEIVLYSTLFWTPSVETNKLVLCMFTSDGGN